MKCFEEHIKAVLNELPKGKIVLGCSGGVDSMVLLSLLLQAKANFEVAHINYQLRGIDSDLDEQLVAETCKRNDIPFHLKKVDLGKSLVEEGGNLQHEARKVRHAFFKSLLQSKNDRIALAHHKDDQVESFFLALARGANTNSLAGMKDVDGNLIRPLLKYSRDEILNYAKEHKIEWREDRSNSKNDYARNKLRNIFIPELIEKFPDLKEQILLLMETFQVTKMELSQAMEVQLDKLKSTNKLLFEDFDTLDHDELLELLRQINLKGIFAKELNKLRHAENEKFLFVAKQKLTITRKKDHFLFSQDER